MRYSTGLSAGTRRAGTLYNSGTSFC